MHRLAKIKSLSTNIMHVYVNRYVPWVWTESNTCSVVYLQTVRYLQHISVAHVYMDTALQDLSNLYVFCSRFCPIILVEFIAMPMSVT